MKRLTKRQMSMIDKAFIIYMVIAGLSTSGFVLHRDRKLSFGTFVANMTFGWLGVPVLIIGTGFIYLDNHIVIRLSK